MPFLFQRAIVSRVDKAAWELLQPEGGGFIDFSRPAGEPALSAPNSVAWRIFKNTLAVSIGGVAAVILELAEPRVRTGVWRHSGFRNNPLRRLKRTGHAAMATVYGPRSGAETMIAGVRRMHGRVRGETPGGEAYAASDPELLNWVHATAAFGFLQAYHVYAAPLPLADRDRFYRESQTAAKLYGATKPPRSEAELDALFLAMAPRLEASPVIFEFLEIMRAAPILPPLLRPVQSLLVRAAIDLTPPFIRGRLGLGEDYGLRAWERALVRRSGALADRIVLRSSPAVQACIRLSLPVDYLYRKREAAGF